MTNLQKGRSERLKTCPACNDDIPSTTHNSKYNHHLNGKAKKKLQKAHPQIWTCVLKVAEIKESKLVTDIHLYDVMGLVMKVNMWPEHFLKCDEFTNKNKMEHADKKST